MSCAFAGASGSGKTTFTSRLKKMMNNVLVLSMDMYNDGTKVLENNFDDPRIVDYDTLMNNIADLKAGRPTQVPIYDFKQSKRVGYNEVEVPVSRVIIIEGIYALCQRLAPCLDLKIAITGGVHFDLVKRVCSVRNAMLSLAMLTFPSVRVMWRSGCRWAFRKLSLLLYDVDRWHDCCFISQFLGSVSIAKRYQIWDIVLECSATSGVWHAFVCSIAESANRKCQRQFIELFYKSY
jgi:hypothetical protein